MRTAWCCETTPQNSHNTPVTLRCFSRCCGAAAPGRQLRTDWGCNALQPHVRKQLCSRCALIRIALETTRQERLAGRGDMGRNVRDFVRGCNVVHCRQLQCTEEGCEHQNNKQASRKHSCGAGGSPYSRTGTTECRQTPSQPPSSQGSTRPT